MPTQTPSIIAPTSDIAIVLDSSGSVGYKYFETVKLLVAELAHAITAYSDNRLIFITYSEHATTRIHITDTLSRKEIRSTILDTPWEGGDIAATNSGIDLAIMELTHSPRHNALLNMIVFTSGDAIQPDHVTYSADWAANEGIRTFSVALSPYITQQELLTIAGNDASRVFTQDDLQKLIELFAPIQEDSMCLDCENKSDFD